MLRTEIAEVMDKVGVMYDVAEKVEYRQTLTSEEKEIAEISDAWVREIGKTGNDKDHEIAAFVNKVVNEEIYNAPDEVLDSLFDRGNIGEFDEVEYAKVVRNTLDAHEAAKGGTVNRSWIDLTAIKPITKNRQIDTDLSYADMRKNGFKSVATITTYAKEALQNMLFYDVFAMIDKALVAGEQVVTAGGAVPTQAAIDKFNLYLLDRDSAPVAVCLNKYAQAMGRMTGRAQFMSDAMKDDFNRYGLVNFVDGVRVAGISGGRLTGSGAGQLMLPNNRIFGVAGKIGNLDMKGELHTYEDMDNSNEKVILRIKDFTYSIGLTNIDKCNKMVLTD